MNRKRWIFLLTFFAGAIVGRLAPLDLPKVFAQGQKPITISRLYTGTDNVTHVEEMELKFAPGTPGLAAKLQPVVSAEIHRSSPSDAAEWHRGPRRQYVLTLSGHGEIEIAGGKKIPLQPGHIELIEDTTGQGHITRITGNEERVTLQMTLADQTIPAASAR
jgi:hypothetical protein